MMHLLISWIFTALLFLALTALPIGVEIAGFGTALVVAVVFGLLNAFVKPILLFFSLPFTILTFGLFLFVVNACVFALAAAIVPGFRLRNGFASALWGSLALSVMNWAVEFLFRNRLP